MHQYLYGVPENYICMNFLDTLHCIRVPEFSIIFKIGANKHFVDNRIHVL